MNDLDCYLANFWRALQHDPDGVARHADWPVNEADLHARHQWLSGQRAFRDRMLVDPEYFDARIAGWWVWGQCLWIGSGWCGVNKASTRLSTGSDPNLSPRHRRWQGGGQGGGSGVHAPSLVRDDPEQRLREYMRRLAARLRCVRVCCGDWRRVLAPSVSTYIGTTGVLLDPPYAQDLRARCYAQDHDISADVREWALAHGDDRKLRIALCGYEHEHAAHMPPSWTCVAWKALGGYSRSARGRTNREQERVWFSPHCLQDAPPLFRDAL